MRAALLSAAPAIVRQLATVDCQGCLLPLQSAGQRGLRTLSGCSAPAVSTTRSRSGRALIRAGRVRAGQSALRGDPYPTAERLHPRTSLFSIAPASVWSSDIPSRCVRCVSDTTLPPPPAFPVYSLPLPPRSARFVSDLLFTPPALRPWVEYRSDIHSPLLVDHANLLLALSHVTPAAKRKRRLRHLAEVTYTQQRRSQSADELSALEVRARRAIDGALLSGGGRLTPLPGWTAADVLAVRCVRGERGRQHLRWPHPRISHHQLKMVDVIERHRAHRDSSEAEQRRQTALQRRARAAGVKAWKLERMERGYVSPAKWRVPRHLRWLMWKRQHARRASNNITVEEATGP